jgi:hypothetical protein
MISGAHATPRIEGSKKRRKVDADDPEAQDVTMDCFR